MIIWVLMGVIGIFVILSVYLYFNQKSMIFYPAKELALTPDQLGLPYEEIYLAVADNQKTCNWFFPSPDSLSDKVVLFCHGNAGNISHRMGTAEFLLNRKVSVLLCGYRGYGKSEGEPDENNLYADARACYDWLVNEKHFLPQNIILFGRSLGGAVAIDLATKVKCGGLAVESSFTSVADMGRKVFPIFPIRLLLRYKFDSLAKISSVKCPVLITHSMTDDLVPFEMGQKLFEQARQPKRFVEIQGKHNDREYLLDSSYIAAFENLIEGRN